MNMYFIGIDWADQKYDLVILDESGKFACPGFEIEKSDDGFNTLLNKLRKLSSNPADFKIGIETSNNLLVDYLVTWDYPVFFIHPSSMESFRRRYRTTKARDDKYDAYVLADVARTDKLCWRKVERGCELTRQISLMVFDHLRLTKKQTMLHNTFKQILKEYYPEYIHFFKDVSCRASLAFINAYPNFDLARQLSFGQLNDFFKKQHFYNKRKIDCIYQTLQSNYIAVPEAIIKSKSMFSSIYVRQLIGMNTMINEFENQIKQTSMNHPDFEIFLSFPGAGEITSARLIALFGDNRDMYSDASIIQAIAGTSPVTEITGMDKKRKKCHKIIYFRQGCNKVFRTFAHNLAFSSLTKSEWCKSFYDNRRELGNTHNHAIRCLASIQLRILFAMWKNRTKYDENIFLAQRTRHQLKTKKNRRIK